jgi:DNA segregation ATPase FtsK/SpoIIIE, S-DNA-T family
MQNDEHRLIEDLAARWVGMGGTPLVGGTPEGQSDTRLLPPTFAPAPRRYLTAPAAEVEIQPPPAPINPSTVSLLNVFLPLVGALLIVSLPFLLSSGGSQFAFFSLPMALIAAILGAYNYYRTRKQYREQVKRREDLYYQYVESRLRQLKKYSDQQRDASLIPNPGLDDCMERARLKDRDLRLWERSSGDSDFLHLRLGTGVVDSTFRIKPPEFSPNMVVDELFDYAQSNSRRYERISDLAIMLPIPDLGAVGLAGPRDHIRDVTRSLLVQMATHNPPDQAKLILIFPQSEKAEWEWARWLQHVWSDDYDRRFMACTANSAFEILSSMTEVIKRRLNQLAEESNKDRPHWYPVLLFVFAAPSLFDGPEGSALRAFRQFILSNGPVVGAYSLHLVAEESDVPRACRARVVLGKQSQYTTTKVSKKKSSKKEADGQRTTDAELEFIGPPRLVMQFMADRANTNFVDRFARTLARLKFQRLAGASGLPAVVSLLDVLGVSRIEDLKLREIWEAAVPDESMEVPIGRLGGGQLRYLNLHEKGDGPHGLVAGTTRSGKTAFLSSLIGILAARFHPYYLAFLGIDYKGGDMIREFVTTRQDGQVDQVLLPHLLGVLTNLDNRMTNRALLGLKAELKRRQELFNQAGVGNISHYQKLFREGKVRWPLPRLVIIVDEFAELVRDEPDFIQGLVGVARVGGSLGIHLILATQNPDGIVNNQIWSNARFRIAFRFGRAEDSRAVLKRPDAAYIDARGRAYLQVGENETFELFQAAWGGALYLPNAESIGSEGKIASVELNGNRFHVSDRTPELATLEPHSQLHRLTDHIRIAAEATKFQRELIPNPWLQPLQQNYDLLALRQNENRTGWNRERKIWESGDSLPLEPIVGMKDNPRRKMQTVLTVPFSKKGHLVAFGAAAEEKTAFIETVLLSLALDQSPDQLRFYIIDFAGRRLQALERLPHTAAYLSPDKTEMLGRVIRTLLRTLEQRKENGTRKPSIILVVDNYTELASAYSEYTDSLFKLAEQGRSLGIYLLISTPLVSNFPAKLSSHMSQSVTFQLNNPSEYVEAVGRTGGLMPEKDVFGRGLVRDDPPAEFQLAQLAPGSLWADAQVTIEPLAADSRVDVKPLDEERRAAGKRLVEEMCDWKGAVERIEEIPNHAIFSELIKRVQLPIGNGLAVPLGIDVETGDEWLVDILQSQHFLITGPARSGRSSLLLTWLLALADLYPNGGVECYLMGISNQSLSVLKGLTTLVKDVADTPDKVSDLIKQISDALSKIPTVFSGGHAVLETPRHVLLAVDDFDELWAAMDTNQQNAFTMLYKKSGGLRSIITIPSYSIGLNSAPLNVVKRNMTGFLLGSLDYDTTISTFKLKVPKPMTEQPLKAGRGLFAERGRWQYVQMAMCGTDPLCPEQWAMRIIQRAIDLQISRASQEVNI